MVKTTATYRQQYGKEGEHDAEVFLRSAGYRIRAVNWHSPLGEIDVIAEYNNAIVFVEVKTRSSLAYGSAAEAVTKKKQKRMIRAALSYLKKELLHDREVRFDVLAITPDGIEHIPGAFCAEGYTY